MHSRICIQTDDFDMAEEYQQLRQQKAEIGAVVCFVGLVRELENNASIDKLTLEHYPGMTEQLLQAIIDEAAGRWALTAATVIHRVGELLPSDQIVLVAVASQHRVDAFEAAQFIMDYLKTIPRCGRKLINRAGSTGCRIKRLTVKLRSVGSNEQC